MCSRHNELFLDLSRSQLSQVNVLSLPRSEAGPSAASDELPRIFAANSERPNQLPFADFATCLLQQTTRHVLAPLISMFSGYRLVIKDYRFGSFRELDKFSELINQ